MGTRFQRVIWIVLDSVGIGEMPDAAAYGDVGSDTLGNIARQRALHLPNFSRLGLANIKPLTGLPADASPLGSFGKCTLASPGKDTTTGHWEMVGIHLDKPFPLFPNGFPRELLQEFEDRNGRATIGNKAASGTEIIKELGEEHIRTAKPIAYTSADSVLQVAAHEEHFGLERLYEVCRVARELTYSMNIGRIIARPFVGERPGDFKRTGHRKDFAVTPPAPTLLKVLSDAGRDVVSVGKIGDIYAHVGTGREFKVAGNPAFLETTLAHMDDLGEGGFLMTNFVDFDTEFGHRRDPQGYGRLLEAFDAELPRIIAKLREGDLLILTADHGNDPTWQGTDHTREQIPVMSYMPGIVPGSFGLRKSFADIGQTIARHLRVGPLGAGTAWDITSPAA